VLINQPRMWSTIFAKRADSRGFVEMCVERSQTTPLDVTVDASEWELVHPGCTCDTDGRERLLPNERNPCEWHFAFEALTSPKHSTRIQTLDVDFNRPYYGEVVELAMGSCQFFALSFPQLVTLRWNAGYSKHSRYTFSRSPFTPTIRSLSFDGSWDGFFTQANNLTSLTLVVLRVNAEDFRLFMLSNQSIESLSLDLYLEGDLKGPPVDLLNLKSLTLRFCPESVLEIIRVPTLQHLSSLEISLEGIEDITQVVLTAAVDGFAISVMAGLGYVMGIWEGLTRDAPPTIRHVRYWKYSEARDWESDFNGHALIPLLADAHTLEIGHGYLLWWYPGFVDDLKQLGPQLKTIRFEIPEDTEPFKDRGDVYTRHGGELLDRIEELVKYRFEHGRPFSMVERMTVGETGRVSRLQDYVWRCFYGDRGLGQYVRPE